MLGGGFADCSGGHLERGRLQGPLLPIERDVDVTARVEVDQQAGTLRAPRTAPSAACPSPGRGRWRRRTATRPGCAVAADRADDGSAGAGRRPAGRHCGRRPRPAPTPGSPHPRRSGTSAATNSGLAIGRYRIVPSRVDRQPCTGSRVGRDRGHHGPRAQELGRTALVLAADVEVGRARQRRERRQDPRGQGVAVDGQRDGRWTLIVRVHLDAYVLHEGLDLPSQPQVGVAGLRRPPSAWSGARAPVQRIAPAP